MKICLLTRYFDFRNAGLGRVSLEIRRRLIERGHEVVSVSTEGESLYAYFWYTLFGIRRKMSKGCDVYHAITPMEAMWLPKGKSVVTFHDLFQITHPERLGSGLGGRGLKHDIGTRYFKYAVGRAKRCTRVVAVSDDTQEGLEKHLEVDSKAVKVIRSGIRPDLNQLRPLEGLGRIGYLGQLDRRKRVELLIEAFKQSSLTSLHIGGTGPDKERLKALAGDDPRIHFLERVDDDDLVHFYNSIDVFAFPTWIEGYGLPIVEAMACGRPVILLDDAVLPFEIEQKCIVTEDLCSLLKSPQTLQELASRIDLEGNRLWAKAHDWEKTVDAYEELYRSLT